MGQLERRYASGDAVVHSAADAPRNHAGIKFSADSVMYRNTEYMRSDRPKQPMGYFDSFLALFGSHRLFNFYSDQKRMEVKVLMQALAATGITSYIMGIILNLDNWRSMVLLVLGAAFMVIRICVYTAKSIHEHRVRKWEFEQRKKEAEIKNPAE